MSIIHKATKIQSDKWRRVFLVTYSILFMIPFMLVMGLVTLMLEVGSGIREGVEEWYGEWRPIVKDYIKSSSKLWERPHQ